MEVHSHTHTPRKKWTHYFWEFLMLFLAVFCGFLAENMREHKIEHNRAKDFARSLVKDLHNDTIAIHAHNKSGGIYIACADSLLHLYKKKLEGPVSSQFAFYARFMYWTTPLLWNRATFDQIKNSGGLRYFKNYQMLEKMMKYNAVIHVIEAEDYNRQVRGNLMLNHINKIIPPEYHHDLSAFYLPALDSMSREQMESLYPATPFSLENKRDEIQEMLNMIVVQQRNLRRDITISWRQAEELAIELINDLKKEYHLE